MYPALSLHRNPLRPLLWGRLSPTLSVQVSGGGGWHLLPFPQAPGMRERLPPGQAGHFLLLATVTGAGRTCDPSQPIRLNSGTLVLAAKLPGPSLLQFEDSLLRRRLLRAGDTRLSPDFTEHLDLAEPEAQRSEAKWIPDLSHYVSCDSFGQKATGSWDTWPSPPSQNLAFWSLQEEGPWSQTDMGSNPVSSQTMRPLASYRSWRSVFFAGNWDWYPLLKGVRRT